MHLRQATAGDEAALFDICVRTADEGADASALYSDPRLPGYIWAVPYVHHDPTPCFVVADGEDVVGYVVGAADTEAFERWQRAEWWPRVRDELSGFKPQTARDRQVMAMVRNPPEDLPAFARAYPAHLHINLLPRAQSGGWGRKLIEAVSGAVAASGAPGIHLGVSRQNTRAIGFYKHLGFAEVAPDDEDADGLILGKRF